MTTFKKIKGTGMDKHSKKKNKTESYNPGKELIIYEVSEIREKILQILKVEDDLDLDLGSVTECDIAGVQMLISLLKYGVKRNKNISILNATDAVTEEMSELGFCAEEFITGGN